MRLNRALDNRKPQTTSPRPRCDEGIEQSVTNQRRDPRALVDNHDSIRPTGELGLIRGKLVLLKEPALDHNLPVWGRRLHGIEEEVEDRPVQQVFVALDQHRRGRKLVDDPNAVRNSRLARYEPRGVPRDLGQVELGDAGFPRAGEVEKLRQDAGDPVRFTLHETAQHPLVFRRPRHTR